MDVMMKWWKSLFRNRKGFTIVELICSIAIFSIIMTSVGSALVISARSYRNGNTELGVQQQAQIASNLLTNLIIDSDKVVQASDGKLVVEKMESGGLVTYTVELRGGELIYYTSTDSTERTLAENITGFVINRAEGENVDFSLTVETDGKSYASDYHVTPRNGVSSSGEALSGTIGIFVENRLILEPGQTYDLNVRISGTTNTGFTIDSTDGGINSPDTQITAVGSNIQIKVGSTETDSFHFNVISDADPSVSKNVDVLIRRINDIRVNGYKTGGTVNRAGAEYKVSATLTGDNLEKQPGEWYDVDYVDPYTSTWSFEFTKEEEDGSISHPDYNEYVEITGYGTDSGNIPYVTFKLKRDMTAGCSFKVTGTALHPEGVNPADTTKMTNKSGVHYGRFSDPTQCVSASWTLEHQAWRRNGKLDIAIHHLGEEDMTTSWEDGKPHYTHEASVKFWAYDKYGNYLDQASAPGGYNPWTSSINSTLNAEIDGANIRDFWSLVLNPETDYGDDLYKPVPYSTPYYMTSITDWWNNGVDSKTPDETSGYFGRFKYSGYARKDVASYRVQVDYQYTNEAGELVWDSIVEDYAVEDVTIQYRNALSSNWQRDNVIYVTTLDSIVDYKVYFKFDRGWEGDDYYFSRLNRFVGIVADKANNINDIRRDITVNGPTEPSGITGGNPYLTFTLTADEKMECKALTQGEGDKITVKYEYNPYFGKVNFNILDWGGSKTDLSNFTEPDSLPDGLTQDQMDAVKGCAGSVVFYFKEPNITGATLKAMYCPTAAEYGPVYYIDDTSRFVIAAGAAQYQELVGGTWSTVVNLTWNGTNGWIAN